MNRLLINLNKFEDISKFNKLVNTFSSDVNVYVNHYVLDAKSLMAMFSFDLSKDIEVEIISDDEEEIV